MSTLLPHEGTAVCDFCDKPADERSGPVLPFRDELDRCTVHQHAVCNVEMMAQREAAKPAA